MDPIRTMLHATDFSGHCDAAFQFACLLARDYSARLIVLHVLQPRPVGPGGAQAVPYLPAEFGRKEAEEQLRKLQPTITGVRLEHHLQEGEPVDVILHIAKETPCDLIVLGTQGRTGLGRLLIGSVAEAVLRKAHCPVLTVKAPGPEASKETE
jgi:nucleotide-binding universal stress UspA family protein